MPTAGENIFASDYQGDAKVTLGVAQPVLTSSTTRVEFDTVLYDEHGFWDAVAFEFVIPADFGGLYTMSANLTFEEDVNARLVQIDSSQGVLASMEVAAVANTTTGLSVSTEHRLDPGDTVHCEVRQTSGITLDLTTTVASFALSRIRA